MIRDRLEWVYDLFKEIQSSECICQGQQHITSFSADHLACSVHLYWRVLLLKCNSKLRFTFWCCFNNFTEKVIWLRCVKIFEKCVRINFLGIGLCCKCFIISSLIVYCFYFFHLTDVFSLAAVIQTQEEKDLHHPLDLMMMTTLQMVTTIPTRNLPLQPRPRNLWDQDHITTDSTKNRHPPSNLRDHPHPQEPIRRNLYISESEKKYTSPPTKMHCWLFLYFCKICQEIMLPFVQLTFIISSLGISWTRNSDFSWKCLISFYVVKKFVFSFVSYSSL